MKRTIKYGSEYMTLHENGGIERNINGFNIRPTGQWAVTGAVTYNNFGKVVQTYTLRQILDDPRSIPWKFKNGKQRTFIRDFDHGTNREWRSPDHEVF